MHTLITGVLMFVIVPVQKIWLNIKWKTFYVQDDHYLYSHDPDVLAEIVTL